MSGVITPKTGGLSAKYCGEKDAWFVTVPFGLNQKAWAAAKHFLRAEKVRQLGMLSRITNSDQYEKLSRAIKAIDAGRVHQVVLTKNGGALFASQAKVNPHRTIYT